MTEPETLGLATGCKYKNQGCYGFHTLAEQPHDAQHKEGARRGIKITHLYPQHKSWMFLIQPFN